MKVGSDLFPMDNTTQIKTGLLTCCLIVSTMALYQLSERQNQLPERQEKPDGREHLVESRPQRQDHEGVKYEILKMDRRGIDIPIPTGRQTYFQPIVNVDHDVYVNERRWRIWRGNQSQDLFQVDLNNVQLFRLVLTDTQHESVRVVIARYATGTVLPADWLEKALAQDKNGDSSPTK